MKTIPQSDVEKVPAARCVQLGDQVKHVPSDLPCVVMGKAEFLTAITRVYLRPLKRTNGGPMLPFWANECDVLPAPTVNRQYA